jgi:two-component system response regulator FixJ
MESAALDQFSPLAGPKTIVLVEDDISLLGAMAFALQADGFRVLAYTDGKDLLTAPRLMGVNCLVVDLKMPGIDGLTLISELRARGVTAPAILITTQPDETTRRAASAAGVEIVEKPLLDGELRRRIDAAVLR